MLPYQESLNPSVAKRFRRLAGPFCETNAMLLDGLVQFLTTTGARVLTVGEPDGVCVWRLRSECETLEQTARRLTTQKRRRN